MSLRKIYPTDWVYTLVISLIGCAFIYFVSEVSFGRTIRLELLFILFSAVFVIETAKFRYLRLENQKLITRSGYFSKHLEIPIGGLQGMRAIQQSIVYQPNLEIDY